MLGSKYGKVLNMAGCLKRALKYSRICLDQIYLVLNISWFLNMTNSEYERIPNVQELLKGLNMPQCDWRYLNRTWIYLKMSEYSIIEKIPNIYHAIHSARSLCSLWVLTERQAYSEPDRKSKKDGFGKMIIIS